MADFIEEWNVNVPTDNTDFDQIDNHYRSCRAAIKERLQENVFFDENITKDLHNSDGNFKQLPLSNSESVSSGIANAIILHSEDSNSKAGLFLTDEDSVKTQLTEENRLVVYPYHENSDMEYSTDKTYWLDVVAPVVSIHVVSGGLYEALCLLDIKYSLIASGDDPVIEIYDFNGAVKIYGPSILNFVKNYGCYSPAGSGMAYDTYYKVCIKQFFVGGTSSLELRLRWKIMDSGGQ